MFANNHSGALTALLSCAGAISLLLVLRFVAFVVSIYQKPLPLPVLNLSGWGFSEAQRVYHNELKELLLEGHSKYRGEPYLLWTSTGYQVILPRHFALELGSLSDDTSNLAEIVQIEQMGHWSKLRVTNPTPSVLSRLMTVKTRSQLPEIEDELLYGYRTEFPTCRDWALVDINHVLGRINSIVAGFVIFGKEHGRKEAWISGALDFQRHYIDTLDDTMTSNPVIKSFVALVLPSVRKIWKTIAKLQIYIHDNVMPEIHNDKYGNTEKGQQTLVKATYDALAKTKKKINANDLALPMTITGFEIQFNTSVILTQAIYDLALRPEYVAPLREEISIHWSQHARDDGIACLKKMIKLDSFIQESQRMNNLATLVFQRIMKKPITLSNGLTLPPGTALSIPLISYALDDDNWLASGEFRGFRFAELRDQYSSADGDFLQYGHPSVKIMNFGFGKHVCPAAFFAAQLVKMNFAYLVENYEFELQGDRPDTRNVSQLKIDDNTPLMFRRRQKI